MLQLRKCILSRILAPSPTATFIPPILSLHRLLSATSIPFAVEDYLVSHCGLSRAQALKASQKISHLKSPAKPDAVLAFLADLGLSHAEVATIASTDPLFLCADVKKNLAPRVVELSDIGLSPPEIARLVLICKRGFRSSTLCRNVYFWRQVFGSIDELLRILKLNSSLLNKDLENRVKPNLAFLQGCGISVSKLPNAFMSRMVNKRTEHLQETLALVDEFGIDRDSSVFPRALATFAIHSQQKLNKKIQLFEKLGWSRHDIARAARIGPYILGLSVEMVRRKLDFLIGDVGLEIPEIARKPALMTLSFERRLLPRLCLMNFLKAKGLLDAKCSFSYIAMLGNERFLHRFVHRYEESIPGLTAAFASSCSGKHPWEQHRTKTRKEKELMLKCYLDLYEGLSSDPHHCAERPKKLPFATGP